MQSAEAMAASWQELLSQAQLQNPQAHNRFAQLATIQDVGSPRPAVRTVTVRFFLDDGRLLITTDSRADKVSELMANPACELCWYFTETRQQFRIQAKGHIITATQARLEGKLDAALTKSWQQRSTASQQSLTWPQPRRRIDEPASYQHETPNEVPNNFALLLLEVITVDYLNVAAQPHQRVLYSKLGGQWLARAVNP